jgi:clan AA aspartic protease
MIKKTTPIEEGLRSQSDFPTMTPSANDSQEVKPRMGEVRVKVTLTNAGDEVLVRRGLLSADKVRHYEADALVDSGAIRSVLPRHVVEQLGLSIVRTTRVTYANDGAEDVDVSEVVGIEINGRRTTEETLVLGSEMLIGQMVLESLDLLVDCANQRVVGNPAHPDQPIIKIKMNLVASEMPRVPMHS